MPLQLCEVCPKLWVQPAPGCLSVDLGLQGGRQRRPVLAPPRAHVLWMGTLSSRTGHLPRTEPLTPGCVKAVCGGCHWAFSAWMVTGLATPKVLLPFWQYTRNWLLLRADCAQSFHSMSPLTSPADRAAGARDWARDSPYSGAQLISGWVWVRPRLPGPERTLLAATPTCQLVFPLGFCACPPIEPNHHSSVRLVMRGRAHSCFTIQSHLGREL